jgi:hypothetical protein
MAAPMVVALRGLTTRQATITLDERGCAALADAIEVADEGHPDVDGSPVDPEIERLGRQLRGFLKVWDFHEDPQSD